MERTESHRTCLKRDSCRDPKTRGERKARTLGNLRPLALTTRENIKHSQTPSQLDIEPHTKGPLPQFLLPNA